MVTIVTAAATWGAALFVSLIGLIVTLLVIPGGKGYPTRKKTAQLVGLTPDEAREHIAEKLRRIGCDLEPTDSPASLLATRRFVPKREEGALVNTHADRALRVNVEFAGYGASTLARTSVRINEFILLDSGEARYAQGVLDWLTDARDPSPAPPVPPNTSAEALAAFSNAVTSLAAWAIPLHLNLQSHLPPHDRQPAMIGFAIG